jgi:outer membrane receptor for ferrienterochelin and colicin
MNNWSSGFFLFLFLLGNTSGFAQTPACTGNIIEISRDSYEIGEFAIVKRNLQACVRAQGFGNLDELNQARELLALTAIVEDETEKAKSLISEIVSSNSNFPFNNENIVFKSILDEVKRENVSVSVSSVSKKAEDLNKAPATVKIVTHEEIMDRGYKDLIEVLSDLPGFDISKTYSLLYANTNQLGFRQEDPEETLFMIDGVEENDIWSNRAYISRQIPLSNVKVVEILYGPSSTMYGPRAFIGAINVITYAPKDIPEDSMMKRKVASGKPSNFYAYGNMEAGDFRTAATDLTMGIKGKSAAFQVTGRYFRSDEHDLSSTEFYNYSPDDINHLSYNHMTRVGRAGSYTFEEYLTKFKLPQSHPYYTLNKNSLGLITSMRITAAGINAARSLDSAAYAGSVNGAPIGYSNASEDYYVSAKLTLDNFLFGIRHWKTEEGYGKYQDIDVAGSRNGSVWAPQNTTIYGLYDKDINQKISISNLTTFAFHNLAKETNRVNFIAFGDPRATLHFAHLLNPTQLIERRFISTEEQKYGTETLVIKSNSLIRNGWRNRYFYYEAQQFRNETRFFYEGNKLKISSGIDFRSSVTPGNYQVYMDFDTNHPNPQSYQDKQKNISLAREEGIVSTDQAEGSNMYSILDIGFFNQATLKLGDKFILSGGNRIDYNKVRDSGGFGLVMSPRISGIYYSKHSTFKLIYANSNGMQHVSPYIKYSTDEGRTPNPNLRPEPIKYINLEYLGQNESGSLRWEVIAFQYRIEDAVSIDTVFEDNQIERRYENASQYDTFGLMSGFYYKPKSKSWNIQINHTYLEPWKTRSKFVVLDPKLRIGDIATHRINLSITKKTDLGPLTNVLNLRANYVSARPVGPGTTQAESIGLGDNTGEIPAYLLVNGNIAFKAKMIPFLRLDLGIENILNKNILDNNNPEYYHPGPENAAGSFNLPGDVSGTSYGYLNVPYFTQRPRFMTLKLSYSF